MSRTLTSVDAKSIAATMTRTVSASGLDWGVLAAAGVLTIVPGALVIWFVRNYIAKGFRAGEGVMLAWSVSDFIALYGALLSTVIALFGLLHWLFGDPKAQVEVFNSNDSWPGKRRCSIVVSNLGGRPFVIRDLTIMFFQKSLFRNKFIHEDIIDQKSRMNPAWKSVKDDPTKNEVRYIPRVIGPGEEYIAVASEPDSFDTASHWICVTAHVRGSSRRFSGQAPPVSRQSSNA